MGSHQHDAHASPQDADPIQVEPIDPLHDIDGKRTMIWVIVFVVVVFGSMWLLAVGFAFVLEQEHQVKIYDRETVELNALHAVETQELNKTEDLGDGKQRISIDEAMRRLAVK